MSTQQGKDSLLRNGVGKTGQTYVRAVKLNYLAPYTISAHKWFKGLNVRPEIKELEGNIGLYSLRLVFINKAKATQSNTNKWN